MKNNVFHYRQLLVIALSLYVLFTGVPGQAQEENTPTSLYSFSVLGVNDQVRRLEEFRGKVALVVNTASQCGFTPQYQGLEALYQRYKDRGFVVLAFPSNQFGGQEPGSNAEIKKFCELKYRTTFPVFAKGSVTGADKQPVYAFLTEQSPESFRGEPGWNFVKFLVGRDGTVIGRFSSLTTPLSSSITEAIEAALAR